MTLSGNIMYRCALGALAATASMSGATVAAMPSADAVVRAEDERLHAEVAHNVVALRRSTATDLWYVHADGRTQDQANYLATIAKGDSPVVDARISGRTASVHRGQAVTHGTVDYTLRTDPVPRRARYVGVYRWRQGVWQLVAWQNTAVRNGD